MGGKKKYINIFGSFTKPFNYLGLAVWQTPSVLENDMAMENSVITQSVFPVITVNVGTVKYDGNTHHEMGKTHGNYQCSGEFVAKQSASVMSCNGPCHSCLNHTLFLHMDTLSEDTRYVIISR